MPDVGRIGGVVFGLNAPADMRLAPQFFAMMGARWIRVVLKPEYDLTPWIQDAHRRGLKVLGVIARESLGDHSLEVAVTMLAARYRFLLDAVQAGNEADHVSPSSWTMTQDELNHLLTVVNAHFLGATIIGPGMVSGDPHYLDAVDLELVNAIAVHPYGQRPDALQDWPETPGNFGVVGSLLDSYRYHNRPIWVTEVGVSTREVSEDFQARYCEAMLKALKLRSDVPVVCWFASDDQMVPEFGLFGYQHDQKPAAAAFMKVAGPISDPEPLPVPTQKAIDVSSHQPLDLTGLIQQHQPQHVIVKLYMPWENIPWATTAAQVASARRNGCTVGGYVWAYHSADPIATIDAVIARCASIDLALPLLWIDCETYGSPVSDPGPDANWLARAVDHAENAYGMKCGIYTGRWWVRDYFPGGESEFAHFNRLPLWLSLYDATPDINVWQPFSGFTQLAAKQWSSSPIDLNVIRPEYTVYEGGGDPEPDPCAHLHQQLLAWRDRKPYKAVTKKQLTALIGGS